MTRGVAKNGVRKSSPRVARVAVACEYCGAVREFLPGFLKIHPQRFCSRRCMGLAKRQPDKHITLTCDYCGKSFVKDAHRLKPHNFCSVECRWASRRDPGAHWNDPRWIKDYMRAYNQRERIRLNEKKREYMRRHPGMKLSIQRARRASASASKFTRGDWEALKAKYNYTCLACGRAEPEITLTLDHVVPLKLGGEHEIGNMQPLCHSCNSGKGARTVDYRAEYGIDITEVEA